MIHCETIRNNQPRAYIANNETKISIKTKANANVKELPGGLGVPDRIIFKRKMIEITIHILNDAVFIEKGRLIWVIGIDSTKCSTSP